MISKSSQIEIPLVKIMILMYEEQTNQQYLARGCYYHSYMYV